MGATGCGVVPVGFRLWASGFRVPLPLVCLSLSLSLSLVNSSVAKLTNSEPKA